MLFTTNVGTSSNIYFKNFLPVVNVHTKQQLATNSSCSISPIHQEHQNDTKDGRKQRHPFIVKLELLK